MQSWLEVERHWFKWIRDEMGLRSNSDQSLNNVSPLRRAGLKAVKQVSIRWSIRVKTLSPDLFRLILVMSIRLSLNIAEVECVALQKEELGNCRHQLSSGWNGVIQLGVLRLACVQNRENIEHSGWSGLMREAENRRQT